MHLGSLLFPWLESDNHARTSDPDDAYNCAAWAARDTERLWWPAEDVPEFYWPPDARRDGTVEAIIDGYTRIGFQLCDDPDLEQGFEKIAIYLSARDSPKHVARQKEDGRWTSKLGEGMDIEHTDPHVLASGSYGNPRVFMRRPMPSEQGPPA